MRDGCIWSMGTYDEKNGLQYTDALTLEQLQPMLQNRAVLQQGPLSFYIEPLVGSPGRSMSSAAGMSPRSWCRS